MKMNFLGAVGVVTGSCTWLQDEERGWNFLIDCGLNLDESRGPNWNHGHWPFDPSLIQFVGLTHAHLDHCGLIPLLYKRGFKGPIYCTKETALIATKILEEQAKQEGSCYTSKDVAKIVWKPFRDDLPLAQPRPVNTDLFLRAYRSGHIIGAVSLAVLWGAQGPEQKSIIFSGDIGPGCEDQEGTSLIRHPWKPLPANYAVIESTYGNLVRSTEQKSPDARRENLQRLLERVVEQEGTLLLPAFAIGRIQDVLFDLHAIVASDPKRFAPLKVLLDAPLASRIQPIVANALETSEVTGKNGKVRLRWLGKQVFRLLGLDDKNPDDIDTAIEICRQALNRKHDEISARITQGNEVARNWKALIQTPKELGLDRTTQPDGPTVIVCGSADGENGAAAKWLPTLLSNERNIIASTGYTSAASVMTRLMSLATTAKHERRRHTGNLEWSNGQVFRLRDISADLIRLAGYSAHADQQDLVNWILYTHDGNEVLTAPTVFIQHGEDPQRRQLNSALQERAAELGQELCVIQPKSENWYDLD